jgi:Protein of Unknown function (DUF2784)
MTSARWLPDRSQPGLEKGIMRMTMTSEARYRRLAETATVFHFLWTFLLWGGMILVFFWHAYVPYEIAALSITLLSNIPFRGVCPLTYLEEKWRGKLDMDYVGNKSCTTTYVNKFFKTNFSVRSVNIVIAILYVLAYASLVAILVRPQ